MSSKKSSITRRKFLRNTSWAAGGIMILPRHVLGRGFTAPSDKLNIGGVGVGGRAETNLPKAYNNGTDNIAALCDVDDRRSANARKKWPGAPYYKDYRVMLEKEGKHIDAVMITTPDHMHAPIAMAAMELGKHVYVEKPLTHDIYEARMLTEAAKKYKVVTQMGNQGASGDDIRLIQTWLQDGLLGDVHTVHVWTNRPTWPQGIASPTGKYDVPPELDWNLWLGTAPLRDYNPAYLPAIWRGWVDYGSGSLGDMGCHFIDSPYLSLKLGYPVSAETSIGSVYKGYFDEVINVEGFPPSAKTYIHFPQRGTMVPVKMVWYDGGILPERPAELLPDEEMSKVDGGMIFEGTKGKLMAGKFGANATLLPTSLMKDRVMPKSGIALVDGGTEGHQQQWVQACKKGYGAFTSSDFAIAGPLTETVLMGNLAVRSYQYSETNSKGEKIFPGRKKLLWDGEKMEVINFAPANQFVKRTYRSY